MHRPKALTQGTLQLKVAHKLNQVSYKSRKKTTFGTFTKKQFVLQIMQRERPLVSVGQTECAAGQCWQAPAPAQHGALALPR